MSQPLFNLSDLTLSHGRKPVLSGVNLCIQPGEVVALVGESGCGKTTLLSHMRSLRANDTAWCPQDPGLVSVLSAFHNIYAGTLDQHNFLYNLRQLIKPSAKEWQGVVEVTEPLGIVELLGVSLDKLSGGELQRVNIARACIQSRPLFLGDEPVSALDEYQREHVLKQIIKRHDSCVITLHDLDLALNCCSRIIGIADGKVLVDSPVDSVDRKVLATIFRHHGVNSQVQPIHAEPAC